MRFGEKLGVITLVLIVFTACPGSGYPYDIGNPLFHSGITVRGHSGLLFTKAGTSIAAGTYFVGLSPDYFDRDLRGGQSEKRLTVPLNITYGFPHNIEFAGNIGFVDRNNSTSESGFSDLDLSVKWSFLQEEGMSFPSMAAGILGRFALGDEKKGLTDIDDYGIEFFLSGTALIDLAPGRDYAFGLYGEAGAVLNDWGQNSEEKHGRYSAGILLPFPSYSDLAFILEFGGTINRGFGSNKDFIRLTPVVRLNHERASFTFGVSLVSPEASGEDSYLDYTLSVAMGF
jgi:hypothetical protein